MRAKLLILFLGLLGLFIAVTAFRVDQILYGDRVAGNETQAQAQLGALTEALRADLSGARTTLELAWPVVSEQKKDYGKDQSFARFQMLGSLTKGPTGDWSFDAKYFLEGSPVRSWAPSYSVLALKSLKDSQVPVGGTYVLSLLDPTRKVYFLILSHAPSHWLAAVSGPEIFQGALDRQKGQLSTVFAVNSLGQALAHTEPEYVGSLLSEDPVVKELLASEAGAGSKTFQSAQGPLQAVFEQVPQTNVYVVITTPLNALLAGRKSTRWQMILLGLGFALIGAAALMLVLRRGEDEPERAPVPTAVAPGAPKPVASEKRVTAPAPAAPVGPAKDPPESVGQVRLQAYTQAASSLAHELRGPLLSLMGRARLLRENPGEPDMLQSLSKLEDGAREAFTTLHKLLTFSGEKDEPLVETSLSDVLQRTLRLMDGQFKSRGIQLETKIAEVPLVRAQPSLLVKAFEQILMNSLESMDRGPRKTLSVELTNSGLGPQIVFKDAGSGIEAKNLEHIFDPFYTTKSSQGQSGLGLSLALGIVKACGGRINVQSTVGQGTQVEVLFALEDQARVAGEERALAEAPIEGVPAAPVAAKPPPSPAPHEEPAVKEKVELPEVLNDNLMERTLNMIDNLEELNEPFEGLKGPPALKAPEPSESRIERPPEEDRTQILSPEAPLESSPSGEAPAASTHEDFMNFTAKIDKPKPAPAADKKRSRLLSLGTEVRRPGERS